MIEALLELLFKIIAPIVALVVAALIAWVVARSARAVLEARHAGAAGPVWFLSAAVLVILFFVALIKAHWSPARWVDPYVINTITHWISEDIPRVRELSFPYSVFWLSGTFVVFSVIYALLTLLFAWLLGPPPAKMPDETQPRSRKRGLPPPSAAASSREPRMGALVALDSAASAGVVEWLYRNLGYWHDPRPGAEPRYRSWLVPLHRSLAWLKWLSLPIAALGWTSALAWIAAALLHDAIGQLLALPGVAPQDEEEEPAEEFEEDEPALDVAESELVAKLSQELGGLGLCIRPLTTSSCREARFGKDRWPESESGPLWQSVLDQWRPMVARGQIDEGFRPYLHQLEAAAALNSGEDVLINLLPGSGKRAICDLLAAQTALCGACSVLVIVTDQRQAAERVATLRALGRMGGWHWIVGVHDLESDGISGLDPLVEQPEIVVGTVDALERHFMAVSGHWDIFLSTLALVVVNGIDQHDGPSSASLGALCRRLLLLAGDYGAAPNLLATASGLWSETTKLAEEITSRTLHTIEEASNGAPRPAQAIYAASVAPKQADRIRERIRASGWTCRVFDEDGIEGSQSLEEFDLAESANPRAAMLAPCTTSRLPVADRELAHFPLDEPSHRRILLLRLLQPDHSLTTTLFAPELTTTPLPGWLTTKPLIANGWGNTAASAQALQRSLSERECTREELEAHHGKEATDHELSVLAERQLLAQRESAAPDPSSGLPVPRLLYRLSDPAKVRIASASTVVTSAPRNLQEGSTSKTLISIDRVCADALLYPGYVFSLHGRRFRVADDSFVAEPEPDPVWTLPIRKLNVELEHWTPQQLKLGGRSPIEAGRGQVILRLEVLGVRRFDRRRQLLDEHLFTEPRRSSFMARALVMRFPSLEDNAEKAMAAIHALSHLVQAALPLVLRSSPLDVGTTPLENDDRRVPGLAIVDLHPFGAGFAQLFRPGALRKLLTQASELQRSSPHDSEDSICSSPEAFWPPADGEATAMLLDDVLQKNEGDQTTEAR